MDQDVLVEGGEQGLRRIASVFREGAGFPIEAVYLIKRMTGDGFADWNVVAVVSPFRPGTDRDFIYELVRLRRAGLLPRIDEQVRVNAVSADNIEASRLLDYARQMGRPPLVIRNAIWRGLSIEYALVAEDLGARAEAA